MSSWHFCLDCAKPKSFCSNSQKVEGFHPSLIYERLNHYRKVWVIRWCKRDTAQMKTFSLDAEMLELRGKELKYAKELLLNHFFHLICFLAMTLSQIWKWWKVLIVYQIPCKQSTNLKQQKKFEPSHVKRLIICPRNKNNSWRLCSNINTNETKYYGSFQGNTRNLKGFLW